MGKFFKHSHLRDEGVVGYDPTNPKTVLDPKSEFLTQKHKHAPTGEAIDRLTKEWINRKPPKGVRKEGYNGKWQKLAESAVKSIVSKPDTSQRRIKLMLPKKPDTNRFHINLPKTGISGHAVNLVTKQRLDFRPKKSHRITVGKLRKKDMLGNKIYGLGYQYKF